MLKSNIVGFGHWRFEPVLIGKSWRRFADFDGKIIAPYAYEMTTQAIATHKLKA